MVAVILLRAFGGDHRVLAVAANTMGALAACLYVPTLMTALYNQAQRSPCVMRFHIAAEAGWDVGGMAGLAGVFEVTGTLGQLTTNISPGYGFTAIIVAFLGRLNPLAVVPAGILLAISYLGGDAAQIELGMPNAVTGIFQGILLFYFLGCDVLIQYRVVWRRVRRGSATG